MEQTKPDPEVQKGREFFSKQNVRAQLMPLNIKAFLAMPDAGAPLLCNSTAVFPLVHGTQRCVSNIVATDSMSSFHFKGKLMGLTAASFPRGLGRIMYKVGVVWKEMGWGADGLSEPNDLS